MASLSKALSSLMLLPIALYSVDPTTYGTNFGIRQIAVQIASINAIPVYGPGNPTLNQSGTYALANDIDDALVIEHDNVTLSLNGYRVKGDSLLGYGILVDGYKHITLGDGVVGPDTPGTVAASIKISNAQDIYLENCNLINAQQGIDIQSSSNVFAKNCRSQFFTQTGFNEYACTTCIMENCYALTSTTDNSNTPTNVSGFSCVNGINNAFQGCQTSDLISSGTTRYTGFYLQDSNKIDIRDCIIDLVQTESLSYGMYLFTRLKWEGLPNTNSAADISHSTAQRANSPEIAFDVNGNAIAIWEESNGSTYNIYARSFDGTDWSLTATNISNNPSQDSDSPQITFDANGNALAVWREFNGSTNNIYARSFNGTDWSLTATNISNDPNQNAESPQIAFDINGNALAIWSEYNSSTNQNNIYARSFNGTDWSLTATNISNDINQNAQVPQIAFDTNDNALAVWQENNSATNVFNIYARFFDGTDWSSTASNISNDPNQIAQSHQIAFDTNGNAMAIWSEFNGAVDSIYARFFDGTNWSTATNISSDQNEGAGSPQIAFDANDNAMAVWYEYSGSISNIYARFFDGTNWNPDATNISNSPNTLAIFPQIAFDTDGNALAIWQQSNSFTAKQNIYTRTFDGTSWSPAFNISNNVNQMAETPQIAFDINGNAMAIWHERNSSTNEFNIYTREYNNAIVESKNTNCTLTNNLISNINTTSATGTGIYGEDFYNVFTKNKIALCAIPVTQTISAIQNGYVGSNFMYNVAL